MSAIIINELTSSTIEVIVPMEWAGIGKGITARYAIGIAEAFSLGGGWSYSRMSQRDDGMLAVRLTKTTNRPRNGSE